MRVQRQKSLEPLERVENQKSKDAVAEQGRRVVRPLLFDIFLDASHFVGENFEPPENGMHKGTLSFEHACHVSAQGLRTDEDQTQKDRDLQNTDASHNFLLELLGTQQGVDQVDKQP